MNPEHEATLRADFTAYYETDRKAKQQLLAQDPNWAFTNSTAWRIAWQYNHLPVDDPRHLGWQYLSDLTEKWERDPAAMHQRFAEVENHHAAGTPVVGEVELRHHRQAHLLHYCATGMRKPQPNAQRDTMIERSR